MILRDNNLKNEELLILSELIKSLKNLESLDLKLARNLIANKGLIGFAAVLI